MNAIFLLSVVMFIVLDAIERFFEPKRIENPLLVLCVAAGGFAINVIGMIMFCVRFMNYLTNERGIITAMTMEGIATSTRSTKHTTTTLTNMRMANKKIMSTSTSMNTSTKMENIITTIWKCKQMNIIILRMIIPSMKHMHIILEVTHITMRIFLECYYTFLETCWEV